MKNLCKYCTVCLKSNNSWGKCLYLGIVEGKCSSVIASSANKYIIKWVNSDCSGCTHHTHVTIAY